MDAAELVAMIGPCSQDVGTCEIMRTAIFLENAASDNEQAQAIRTELAKVACHQCQTRYLNDILGDD